MGSLPHSDAVDWLCRQQFVNLMKQDGKLQELFSFKKQYFFHTLFEILDGVTLPRDGE